MTYPDPNQNPYGPTQQYNNPQPSNKKKRKWPWVAGGLAALVVVGAAIGGNAEDTKPVAAKAETTTSVAAARETISAAEKQRQQEAAAQRAAQLEAQRAAEAAAEAERKDPATYQTIGDRDFALITKNPDASAGQKIVLYAKVTQFDAASSSVARSLGGTDAFRAAASPQWLDYWSLYGESVVVSVKDASLLTNVVQDDIVKLYVEVEGSFSYDTQIGGSTTAPHLRANIVEVVG